MTVDVESLPHQITAERAVGAPYAGVWVLVRSGRHPRGLLKLSLADGPITRAGLQAAIGELPAGVATDADPAGAPAATPFFSVVACTMMSREDELRDCLASFERLNYPNYEILLVDNRPAGAEGAWEWIRELPRVSVLRETRPGLSAARNCALAAASGEFIAYTDDDCVVDPEWLNAFAERFAGHPDEVCVTGLILPNNLESEAQAEIERFYDGFGQRRLDQVSLALERKGSVLSAPRVLAIGDDGNVASTFPLFDFGKFGAGGSMAFRVDALRSLGGFDIRLGPGTPTHAGEELFVFARLAWRGDRLAFVPAAIAYHTHRRDYESLRQQIRRYGVGYTAATLALMLSDRRLMAAMLMTLPSGGFALARAYVRKRRAAASAPAGASGEPSLARLEALGMLEGPGAYLRSWLRTRRLRLAA